MVVAAASKELNWKASSPLDQNFRSRRLERRSSIRARNSRKDIRAIIHDKLKDLIEASFYKLVHGYAGVHTHTLYYDPFKFRNIEPFISIL